MVGNHQETRNDKIKTLNESTCWLNQQQMAVGYRVRGVRGNQFKQWATEHIPIFFFNSSYNVRPFTVSRYF